MTANGTSAVDTREIPRWINEAYFSQILQNSLPDFKRVVKLSTINATQPGENYVSTMVRVHVDLEKQDNSVDSKSFIVKTTMESADAESIGAKFIGNLHPFPREVQMYRNILPKCKKLYQEQGLDLDFGPSCLEIEETPERTTFVMEDLKDRGFNNENRLQGLDFPHMKATLEKLAEFHAATAVLAELEGPYDPLFDITFFNDNNRPIIQATKEARQALTLKAMRQWNMDNVEYYISKLPEVDKFFDKAKSLNIPNPEGFNVLNHGDTWSNNIMFSHDAEGQVKETLFVDFQMGKWGSPAQDLWYLITSSASLDIKIKEFDHFVYVYHKRLTECLKILNYSKKIPTLPEMHIMMIQKSTWSYLVATSVMTAVLFPSDSEASMDNLFKASDDARDLQLRVLVNPYYVNAMKQLFPFWELKGVFDFQTEF